MRTYPIAVVAVLALFPQFGDAAQRTFVSGAGSDAGACTISTPCRGFAAALTHTDPDGEIIVLDSAGYGPAAIDKSVSIVAPAGVYAGISVFSGDGIVIVGAGIDVVLRGLTINGQGGNRGILYTLGGSLRISKCVISNMTGAGVTLGWGGEVTIEDSVIRDNGGAGVDVVLNPNVIVSRTTIDRNGAAGISFHPSATETMLTVTDSHITNSTFSGISVNPSNVSASLAVAHSTIARNGSYGASLTSTSASSPIAILLNQNSIVQNSSGLHAFSQAGAGVITGVLTGNFVSGHVFTGVQTSNTGALLVLDRNTVTHNSEGIVRATSSIMETRSNNTVRENATNLQGTPYTAVGGI